MARWQIIPYLIIQLYGFVAPALYEQEKRYSLLLVTVPLYLLYEGSIRVVKHTQQTQ